VRAGISLRRETVASASTLPIEKVSVEGTEDLVDLLLRVGRTAVQYRSTAAVDDPGSAS
jgi:hypothetical protein